MIEAATPMAPVDGAVGVYAGPLGSFEMSSYLRVRDAMRADPDWQHQYAWAEAVRFPATPDDLARELIFVICNSGMRAATARRIFARVCQALSNGLPVASTFGHANKCRAIERIHAERAALWHELGALHGRALVDRLAMLDGFGPIIAWHGAKNLGADVAKPDRWLERLAYASGTSVDALCRAIATRTGERIGTVDLVLWWGLSHGHLAIAISRRNARP
jgi:hypothetical protein